ncbi:hypothetical protein PENTCL1PPCAC_4150, partial [Pristionchus entomophagus]
RAPYGFSPSPTAYSTPLGNQISRSSMTKAWRMYLDEMDLDKDLFTCVQCGQYPSVLISDGICLGSRADIGASLPQRGDTPITTINPGWIVKKRERYEIRAYAQGNINIPTGTPSIFLPFIESTLLPDRSINPILQESSPYPFRRFTRSGHSEGIR